MNVLQGGLPSWVSRTSNDVLQRQFLQAKEKEDAALTMCGGYLGECFLLGGVIDWVIFNMQEELRGKKWFKQEIKQCFNGSAKSLADTLRDCRCKSPSGSQYMIEMTDALHNALELDLFKLEQSINLELGKSGVKDSGVVSKLLLVNILFQYIQYRYDQTIEYMRGIYNAFYDSWFRYARMDRASSLWNKGVCLYIVRYEDKKVDMDSMYYVKVGLKIIGDKLHNSDVMNKVKEVALEYSVKGDTEKLLEEAKKKLYEAV